jgi:DNA-binding MarR family transcriptional regulator
MSSGSERSELGLRSDEAAQLGDGAAIRVRMFRLILVVAHELRQRMDALLRPDLITTQQAMLINVVDAAGSSSITDIAARIGMTHQNVRQLANALERKGLLAIVADEDDGRVRRLVTTKASRAIVRRRRPDQQFVAEWFACYTDDEARTLFDLLLRLDATMQSARNADTL